MALRTGDPRRSRTYQRLRAEFLATRPQPCWRCDGAIDYDGPPRSKLSATVDHAVEVDSHPELALDPGNFLPAHLDCNSRAGARYGNDKRDVQQIVTIDPGPSRAW